MLVSTSLVYTNLAFTSKVVFSLQSSVLRPLLLLIPLGFVLGAKKPVTLADISAGGFTPPLRVQWSPDGKGYLMQEGGRLVFRQIEPKVTTEVVKLAELEGKALKDEAPKPFDWENRRVTEERFQWSADGRKVLAYLNRDIFLIDVAAKSWVQLTATKDAERDPKLSPDGKRVSFRRGGDLYVMDVASKRETRLTKDGSATLLNGQLDWVYPEELDLGTAHWWAPDSSTIAYLQFDITGVGVYPHADLLKLDTPEEPERYPKAGSANSHVRLGVAPAGGGKTRWLAETEKRTLFARVYWTPDARTVIAQRTNRVQSELALIGYDARTGKSRTILEEKDPHWVNVHNMFRPLADGKSFLWASERSGFRHLYVVPFEGGEPRALTSGEWEVSDLACVNASEAFYLSTEPSPLERQFYSVPLAGGERKRITFKAGTHTVSMAPGCAYLIDSHSSLDRAPRRTLLRANAELIEELQPMSTRVQDEFELLPAEIHQFKGADGALFYGRMIKPAGFVPGKKYPAVVMVYGGPHVQTVRDSWAGLTWDQVLAHKGFVIWQMDNRGSAGRGHAWEAKVNRNFGHQELADQLTGLDYLTGLGFVDEKKIGLYGWSFGGYMTLFSLLHAPDRFAAGISGAPVTDWRLYDTIYTERYMGLPQENEVAYKNSSPVHAAANLRAKLLLVHNYGDDNVLFQNIFMMSNALQQAGKPFEMMVYPQKSHAVGGVARKHLLETTTAFFERHLKQ